MFSSNRSIQSRFLTAMSIALMFGAAPRIFAMVDNLTGSPGILSTSDGSPMVPMDIQTVDLTLTVNIDKHNMQASAAMEFLTRDEGMPYFDLKPQIQSLIVDGKTLAIETLRAVTDADRATTFVYIAQRLVPGRHTLKVTYDLSETQYCFFRNFGKSADFDCFFYMYDLTERTFFEQYAPTNFEFDRYKMTVEIRFPPSMNEHTVMSNADVATKSGDTYKLTFPDYFTSSSFFLHIIPIHGYFSQSTVVAPYNYPLTVYSRDPSVIKAALNDAQTSLQVMSSIFGRSKHNRFTVLLDRSFLGGMEFAGATITNEQAISHEIAHSWFGRGTLSANGNAGWIDEGIVTWIDQGYREMATMSAVRGRLAMGSKFQRMTPGTAYFEGGNFFGRLNYELKSQGGLVPLLIAFHDQYFGVPITTEGFRNFVNSFTGRNFDALFNEFAY